MSSKGKIIGTKAETAVVKACQPRGFAFADRRALKGSKDVGDVLLCPGIIIEVKGGESARSASENQCSLWLEEAEVERVNAGAALGFLVVQRRGVGEANAHMWWAYTTTAVIANLVSLGQLEIDWDDSGALVRLTLEDMLDLLVCAGWGGGAQ